MGLDHKFFKLRNGPSPTKHFSTSFTMAYRFYLKKKHIHTNTHYTHASPHIYTQADRERERERERERVYRKQCVDLCRILMLLKAEKLVKLLQKKIHKTL